MHPWTGPLATSSYYSPRRALSQGNTSLASGPCTPCLRRTWACVYHLQEVADLILCLIRSKKRGLSEHEKKKISFLRTLHKKSLPCRCGKCHPGPIGHWDENTGCPGPAVICSTRCPLHYCCSHQEGGTSLRLLLGLGHCCPSVLPLIGKYRRACGGPQPLGAASPLGSRTQPLGPRGAAQGVGEGGRDLHGRSQEGNRPEWAPRT